MSVQKKLRKFVRSGEFIVFAILVIVMCSFSILNPAFLTLRNMFDLLRTMIVTGIFACGVMMIIISGGIDMSFMAIAICSAYMTIRFSIAVAPDLPFVALALVSMVIGILFGMCNAFLVNTFEMPIFIATLSLATTIRGLMLAFVGNEYIPSPDMPPATIDFSKMYCFNTTDATGSTFGLHFSVFIMLGVMVLTHLIMRHTIVGRGIYALGGDKVAVERVGYNPMKLTLVAYAVFGACCGIAATYFYCNTGSFETGTIASRGTDVITAAIFGGCNMKDGKGSVSGILVGVAIITAIKSNLILLGVPAYYITCVVGLLILGGVLFSTLAERRLQKA